MNVTFKRAVSTGVLCLGLVAAAGAMAQDRPAGPGGKADPARVAEHQKMFEQFRQKREQRLHDVLQIKPDQEGAFRAFLASVEPKPGERGPGGPGHERGAEKSMTTPERLDRMAARMAEHQQRFAKMSAATKTFYAALSPDQRKAFDAMHEGHGGFGGHHGMGRHGFGGGPGGHEFGGPPPPPPPR